MKKEHKLVEIGREKFVSNQKTKVICPFLHDEKIDNFLNDLEYTPHAFVLACLMDRQIKAEDAWVIPYQIKEILGDFNIDTLCEVPLSRYIAIFQKNIKHRFKKDMAKVFYDAVHRIENEYGGDVSKIWENRPSSAKVVYEFLQFNGAGIKIATMATNILVRDFHIPMSDYYSIDISPDVQVMKVMKRVGLIEDEDNRDACIYKAKELCPEYPGIIDYSCWEIGKKYCKKTNPNCKECLLSDICKKNI